MKRLHILLVTAGVALSLVLVGAGAVLAGDPGVTDNEIVIGTSAGLTGPIAMWGNRMARIGPQAYFNYINEQGGVHGRKINHVVLDDGYQPPRSVANHKRLIQRDKVFALLASMGTPTVTASIQTIINNKVPLIAPATGAHKWGYDEEYRPWVFQVGADYWHMAAVAVDYVIEHKGLKKWCVFYQDDDYGKDVLNGTIKQLKQHNLEVVATETYKRGGIDVSGQVTKLRSAGCDVVMLGTVYRSGSLFVREREKLGWDVQTVGIAPTATQTFVDLAGSAGVGHLNTMSNPPVDSDREGVKQFRELMTKYFPDEKISEEALYGFIAAKTFVAGLKAAGRELTRESLIAGMRSLKDYDNGITDTITYGPEDHQGVTASYMLEIVKDDQKDESGNDKYKFKPVSDWITPKGY
jgi:ABC-type branched-subunit amino acid transport system substrate-binding protein